jgi:hypothetical protein
VIYIFHLLMVGRLFTTDSSQQFYATIRTRVVLSKVTAVDQQNSKQKRLCRLALRVCDWFTYFSLFSDTNT